MSVRVSLFVLFFCSFFQGHGQSLPDSIAQRFQGMVKDSAYVDKINLAASAYLRTNPSVTRVVASHAMQVANGLKYVRGYARSLTVMGNSYWYEGVYEFAQNYYLLAARQYQAINDSVGLGQTYNNIGEVYKKLNESEKALGYLIKARELKKRDTATHAITLYNIGELYIKLDNITEAKKLIDESLRIATATHNRRVIAYDYLSLGAIERKKNNYAGALNYYFDARDLWMSLGEIRSQIQTYQDIADIYRDQGKYTEAETQLQNAMNLASQIKVADLQVNNFLKLSRIDSLRGNYKKSLYHLSQHNILKDSVYNLLKAEQIARLQTIYETETREQENQELRNEKELRDAELQSQRLTLAAITIGFLLSAILIFLLYRQRKKITLQKEAIETQAVVLLKLNDELKELNKNLERRIEERTSQLTVQNQRLTEYTFINAHKLRAPVASILGLINLLQQVPPNEKEAILAHLKTCGEQLDSIIREVSRNLEAAIVKET
jgi:tetratricopeptide (TPR) repeat protein